MKKSRDILNKKLIPDISVNKGKVSMSYRLGGTLASSYNSSDVYNFDIKEEGQVVVADPERSYLTTTLYPISSKDSFSVLPGDRVSGRFTDNLYASLGDAENYSTIMPTKINGLFKVALLTHIYGQYASVEDPLLGSSREFFRIFPHTLSGILRDVLKKYVSYLPEAVVMKPMRLSMSMRSVLIKYENYAPEALTLTPDTLKVSSSVTLSGSFESYIPFDAENRVVAEVVPVHTEITDKASVTWSKSGAPIVQNSVSKEGDYALYLNGEGSSIRSQESLEYTPNDSESLIIENWLKPDTITTSLLTRYGGTDAEKGLYYDYAQSTNWAGNNENTNTGQAYAFRGNNPSHFLSNSNVTAMNLKIAAESPNGQTLEINARLSNSSTTLPLVLLSNQSPTWLLSPTGKSAAVVFYGNSHNNPSYAGKIAVVCDNTNNSIDSNGVLLISTNKYDEDSILNIAVVTYGNYLRLFINGKLEAYTILSSNLDFSYLGSYINKATWSATPPDMFYRLYALRFTNFALYTSNYTKSSVYSPRAIPKIKSLDTTPSYPEGISCGVRYLPNTGSAANDRTIVYAALSDGENVYTAESTSIDPSKWNHVRLSIYKNTIVLYVNGVAYSSEIIPFDIELETVSLGSSANTTTDQSFSGYIDNFKMYKDETFDLEGVKYLELRPFLNNIKNTSLEDFNPEVEWKSETTPTVVAQSGTSAILGNVFNMSTNPKIHSNDIEIDSQNFGVRTYVLATAAQSGTILKKGGLSISLSASTLTATANGVTFITSQITANTLTKVDLRYNKGGLTLYLNDIVVNETPVETTLNTNGTLYYGWDGASSLYNGKLGPLSIFDNNRNRVPAVDMLITDFTTENYYKNTVFSLTARDNVYLKDDRLFFDNSYAKTLNDIVMSGVVLNSSVENGLYFNNGSYLRVPANENTVFGVEDFTLEFSVKTNVTDRRQVILDRYFNGSGSWQVSINTDGNLYFTITNSNSQPYYYFLSTTSTTVNDGRWHKVFIARQGTDISVFVDNKLADKFGIGSIFDFHAEGLDFYIGHQGSNNNTNYDFVGYLNNIRITKGAITEVVDEGSNSSLYLDDFDIALSDSLFKDSMPATFISLGKLQSNWIVNGATFNTSQKSPMGEESDGSIQITNSSTTLSTSVALGPRWAMSFDLNIPRTSAVSTGYGIPLMNYGGGTEGSGGFALEYFQSHGGSPVLVLRNAYSSMVSLTLPLGVWTSITVSYAQGVLTLKALNEERTMNTRVNFSNALPLVLGTYSGQWLRSGIFYIDNFRVLKDTDTVPPLTIVYRDPFENPKIENSLSTNFTNNAVSLRTFETGITSDTLTANIWESGSTVLESSISLNSKGSAKFDGTSVQTTRGLGFQLRSDKDFCVEFSFYTTSISKQTLLARGSENSYSYEINLLDGLAGIEFRSYSGILTNYVSIPLHYQFESHRWNEVAICYSVKNGLYYIVNDVIYFPKEKILTVNPFEGNAETLVSLGGRNVLGSETYFTGYIDNFKLTSGNHQYTKGFGDEAAHLAVHISADSLSASQSETTVINHGAEKTTLTPTDLSVSATELYKGFVMTPTTKILNPTGELTNFKTNPFTIIVKARFEEVNAPKKYIIRADRSVSSPVFDVYLNETNQIVVEITQQGELLKTLTSRTIVSLGKWITIGLVRTAQNVLRLYLDGFVIATLNGVLEDFGSSEVSIGDSSGGFKGLLNYIRVYKNKVVTPSAGTNILHMTFDETRRSESIVTDADNERLKYTVTDVNFDYGIDGKYTSSGFFNGLTSVATTPRFKNLDFKNQDFDIELEIFPTDGYNNYQTFLAPMSGDAYKIWLNGSTVVGTNNKICIGTSYDNPLLVSTSTLPFDQWTLIRITRDGSLLRIYINGLLDTTLVLTNEEFNFDGNGQLVGVDSSGDDNSRFKGYISSLKISVGDIVRTINDSKFKVISALDFENNNTDLVLYDYDINMERLDRFRNNWAIIKYSTTTPDPILQTITTSNEAVKLDRSGFICQNKLTHVGFSEFTIETRFMLTASNMSTWRRIIDQSGLYAINITADKRIQFSGGAVSLQSDANAVVVNKWHHVAVTRDANLVTRLFFDGIKIGESSRVVNYTENSHHPLCLGMYYDYRTHSSYVSNHFEGYLDNFYMIHGVCKYVDNFVPNIPSDTVRENTSLAYVQNGVFKDINPTVTWTTSNMSISSTKVKNKEFAMYSSSTSGFLQSTNNIAFKPEYKDFTIDFIVCPLQILAATTLFDNRADALLASGLTVTQPVGNTASFTVNIGPSLGTTDWAISLNTGVNSIASGNYYHLRITRNLGKIYLFLNGSLKASADYTGEIPSSGVITLCNRVNKNQGFTGHLEQFRYVDNTSLAGTSFKAFTQALI